MPTRSTLMERRPAPFLILGLLLVVIFVGLLLYYPERASEATVQKVYFADNISPAHRLVIDKFNAEHRGSIEVVPVDLPFGKFSTNERKELLARSLRNKSDHLDVFSVDVIWVPRFSRWSEPLESLLTPQETGGILPQALGSCTYEGHLMALPLYIDIGMLYYRRDLIRKLPDADSVEVQLRRSITWDDFIALRKRLDLKGSPYFLFPADNFEGLVCYYFEMIAGQDRNVFAANKVDLSTAKAERALQLLVDFVHRYHMSPPEVAEYDEIRSYSHMLRSGGAFVRGWPNFIEGIPGFYPYEVDTANIARAALPHYAGQPPVSVLGGWNLMISRSSTNKEAARTFIRYMQAVETQKMFFDVGGYIPTNSAVYADTAFLADRPVLAYYRALLDRGFQRPQLVEYTRISDIVSFYANLAIKGEMSVHEALTRATNVMRGENILPN